MINALDALKRLQEGNARFIAGESRDHTLAAPGKHPFVEKQEPTAIVLGCSDARVPAEIIFDQGIGDLFVIRVAGNVVAPSGIGSVEFCAEQFGTRLVILLGHSHCGAVTATLLELEKSEGHGSSHLDSIVGRISPVIAPIFELHEAGADPEKLLERSIRANIRASANQLRHGSRVLESLIKNDGLMVIGAEYSLKTGVVDFFDGVP